MRDLKKIKQIHHCNIIPSNVPKWVFLEQTETVFGETKIISQWKQCYRCNEIFSTSHKCIETLEP